DIDDRIRNNADGPIDMDRDAAEFLTQQALIARESTWASTYFKTSTWTGSSTGSDITVSPLWDAASSHPIVDIRKDKRVLLSKTGKMPNVLVLARAVFDILCDHVDIVGRFDRGQTTGVATANEQTLAALFGVEEVLVMDAVQNSAVQGATESTNFIT